jgi:hypothetical protein
MDSSSRGLIWRPAAKEGPREVRLRGRIGARRRDAADSQAA